jgi:multidrug resistance efflux pump
MAQKLKEIELRSEEVQEILTKVPNWMIRWGSALFLLLIVMVFVLSWFLKYPDIITSEAYLTTVVPPQNVYARTTGRLDSIFVEKRSAVFSGQALAIIENTANYKDILHLKSVLDTLNISRDRFSFPIDTLPILFLGEIEENFSSFENSYVQYVINRDLKPYSNEANAQRIKLSELQLRLKNLKSQSVINKRELDFRKKDLQRNKRLFERGVISSMEYETREIDYLQSKRNYKALTSVEFEIREALSTTRMNSKGISINKIRDDQTLLNAVLQSYNQLKKGIKDWEYKYILKSEIAGKVTFMDYWNVNQTVQEGEVIFTIIPKENSSYIAKLKAPARNSGKLKKGQQVNIKLDNYPDAEFGSLRGNVQSISKIPDKDGFYRIDVQLPDTLVTSYRKKLEFQPGMRGTAEIVTEDLRLLERFFYQLRDIWKR